MWVSESSSYAAGRDLSRITSFEHWRLNGRNTVVTPLGVGEMPDESHENNGPEGPCASDEQIELLQEITVPGADVGSLIDEVVRRMHGRFPGQQGDPPYRQIRQKH